MKKWMKPQLVVLVRGRPEESLIAFCKLEPENFGQTGTPIGLYPACWNSLGDCTGQCLDLGAS
jgi:hypothetical protein